MEWMIYDKTRSTVRCIAHKLQYSGTWMGECFVTVDITSPSPIDFAIGDYLEYRGERFEMNYDPSVVKKARKNSLVAGDITRYQSVMETNLYPFLQGSKSDYPELADQFGNMCAYLSSTNTYNICRVLCVHTLLSAAMLWKRDDGDMPYMLKIATLSDFILLPYAWCAEEMQLMYTLVLKAHIALASTIFPPGTCGKQLDAIARRPLWEYGCDYEHGTGHGVGHVLAVHEGPHNISTKSSNIPLEVGMVTSIEPGYYEADKYGIRLENLYEVCPCSQQGCQHMLCFEPLTLVPFDTRLILRELLTPAERSWLNDYHQNVLSVIKNAASTLSDMEVSYLTTATAAI